MRGRLGLAIERDRHFAPRFTLSVYLEVARTASAITECPKALTKAAEELASGRQ